MITLDEGLKAETHLLRQRLAQQSPPRQRGIQATVATVPTGYISGQETALISALSGRPAKPTLTPPYPFQQGLRGRPTLVSNAETFFAIGRAMAGDSAHTRLVTVGGAVARPSLAEIEPGTTFRALLQAVGGPTEPITGILLGGYSGTWTRPQTILDVPLDEQGLRERGLTLGAGIVFQC